MHNVHRIATEAEARLLHMAPPEGPKQPETFASKEAVQGNIEQKHEAFKKSVDRALKQVEDYKKLAEVQEGDKQVREKMTALEKDVKGVAAKIEAKDKSYKEAIKGHVDAIVGTIKQMEDTVSKQSVLVTPFDNASAVGLKAAADADVAPAAPETEPGMAEKYKLRFTNREPAGRPLEVSEKTHGAWLSFHREACDLFEATEKSANQAEAARKELAHLRSYASAFPAAGPAASRYATAVGFRIRQLEAAAKKLGPVPPAKSADGKPKESKEGTETPLSIEKAIALLQPAIDAVNGAEAAALEGKVATLQQELSNILDTPKKTFTPIELVRRVVARLDQKKAFIWGDEHIGYQVVAKNQDKAADGKKPPEKKTDVARSWKEPKTLKEVTDRSDIQERVKKYRSDMAAMLLRLDEDAKSASPKIPKKDADRFRSGLQLYADMLDLKKVREEKQVVDTDFGTRLRESPGLYEVTLRFGENLVAFIKREFDGKKVPDQQLNEDIWHKSLRTEYYQILYRRAETLNRLGYNGIVKSVGLLLKVEFAVIAKARKSDAYKNNSLYAQYVDKRAQALERFQREWESAVQDADVARENLPGRDDITQWKQGELAPEILEMQKVLHAFLEAVEEKGGMPEAPENKKPAEKKLELPEVKVDPDAPGEVKKEWTETVRAAIAKSDKGEYTTPAGRIYVLRGTEVYYNSKPAEKNRWATLSNNNAEYVRAGEQFVELNPSSSNIGGTMLWVSRDGKRVFDVKGTEMFPDKDGVVTMNGQKRVLEEGMLKECDDAGLSLDRFKLAMEKSLASAGFQYVARIGRGKSGYEITAQSADGKKVTLFENVVTGIRDGKCALFLWNTPYHDADWAIDACKKRLSEMEAAKKPAERADLSKLKIDLRFQESKAGQDLVADFQRNLEQLQTAGKEIVSSAKTGRQFRLHEGKVLYRSKTDGREGQPYFAVWGDLGDLRASYLDIKGQLRKTDAGSNNRELIFVVNGVPHNAYGEQGDKQPTGVFHFPERDERKVGQATDGTWREGFAAFDGKIGWMESKNIGEVRHTVDIRIGRLHSEVSIKDGRLVAQAVKGEVWDPSDEEASKTAEQIKDVQQYLPALRKIVADFDAGRNAPAAVAAQEMKETLPKDHPVSAFLDEVIRHCAERTKTKESPKQKEVKREKPLESMRNAFVEALSKQFPADSYQIGISPVVQQKDGSDRYFMTFGIVNIGQDASTAHPFRVYFRQENPDAVPVAEKIPLFEKAQKKYAGMALTPENIATMIKEGFDKDQYSPGTETFIDGMKKALGVKETDSLAWLKFGTGYDYVLEKKGDRRQGRVLLDMAGDPDAWIRRLEQAKELAEMLNADPSKVRRVELPGPNTSLNARNMQDLASLLALTSILNAKKVLKAVLAEPDMNFGFENAPRTKLDLDEDRSVIMILEEEMGGGDLNEKAIVRKWREVRDRQWGAFKESQEVKNGEPKPFACLCVHAREFKGVFDDAKMAIGLMNQTPKQKQAKPWAEELVVDDFADMASLQRAIKDRQQAAKEAGYHLIINVDLHGSATKYHRSGEGTSNEHQSALSGKIEFPFKSKETVAHIEQLTSLIDADSATMVLKSCHGGSHLRAYAPFHKGIFRGIWAVNDNTAGPLEAGHEELMEEAYKKKNGAEYANADANKDGYVSLAEMQFYVDSHFVLQDTVGYDASGKRFVRTDDRKNKRENTDRHA